MKFNKQKLLSGVLATGFALSCLVGPAFAVSIKDSVNTGIIQVEDQEKVEDVTAQEDQKNVIPVFTDIDSSHWAYNYVVRMVQDGLFSGTSSTTFSPNAPMTEIQFLTVVLRKVYPDRLEEFNNQFNTPELWYGGAFELARVMGMFSGTSVSSEAISNGTIDGPNSEIVTKPITREVMASVIVNALYNNGEKVKENFFGTITQVPDVLESSHMNAMIVTYTMGILTGKGNGVIDPKGTATRAEAATVLYRFAYPQERVVPELSTEEPQPETDPNKPVTIYEGQIRLGRPAKAGDTFVKKDGTKIVITLNEDGLIDPALGIAPDIGLAYIENGRTFILKAQERLQTYQFGLSLSGHKYGSQMYQVNPLTGAGMYESEWSLYGNNHWPTYEGSKQFELSKDKCFIWVHGMWCSAATNYEIAQAIKDGLI